MYFYLSVFYDVINFVFTFLYVYLQTKILANFYGLNRRLYVFVPYLRTIIPFTNFRFSRNFLVVNCAVYMSVFLPGLVDIRFLFLVINSELIIQMQSSNRLKGHIRCMFWNRCTSG